MNHGGGNRRRPFWREKQQKNFGRRSKRRILAGEAEELERDKGMVEPGPLGGRMQQS
jgi:hypothetical protein